MAESLMIIAKLLDTPGHDVLLSEECLGLHSFRFDFRIVWNDEDRGWGISVLHDRDSMIKDVLATTWQFGRDFCCSRRFRVQRQVFNAISLRLKRGS